MKTAILLALALAAAACTKAQAASDVQKALTDTQEACAVAEASVLASPLASDLPTVLSACGIAEDLETDVARVISTFFAQRKAAMARGTR
jgi:hypothetical protein